MKRFVYSIFSVDNQNVGAIVGNDKGWGAYWWGGEYSLNLMATEKLVFWWKMIFKHRGVAKTKENAWKVKRANEFDEEDLRVESTKLQDAVRLSEPRVIPASSLETAAVAVMDEHWKDHRGS